MKNEYDFLNDVKMDFSVYEEIPLTEKERSDMNTDKKGKKLSCKKIAGIAACAAVISGIAVSQTAWAKDILNDIIRVITVGKNSVIQMDPAAKPSNEEFLDSVETVRDENGNEINFSKKDGKLIDEQGREIETALFELVDGSAVRVGKKGTGNDSDIMSDSAMILTDTAEIAKYVKFNYKLPASLPEGIRFKEATLFRNENGEPSPDYLHLKYERISDGETFIIAERISTEETGFEVATNQEIEEITVNGGKAVLDGDRSLIWEKDGASISILGNGILNRDELISLAKGMEAPENMR